MARNPKKLKPQVDTIDKIKNQQIKNPKTKHAKKISRTRQDTIEEQQRIKLKTKNADFFFLL